ncbi:hypothetical protein Cenrod_1651 [Candidatus Symbiobacter mobilis CR]|uniref:Uncharacterized protein n=1 Tax=Candidatus Symbiobacter mobilis CR TaxID=946483 RepID=U5N846_9BURK|nr:hypothetical protein Cenrod_1651 [Candidatus Symbiobacter mobilis CR]
MKKVFAIATGVLSFFALIGSAYSYTTEVYGKEDMSTVYRVACENGKVQLVRQEKSNGRWCSGMTCYETLDALMRNAFSSCK